jgi:general secretion pathway protein K
VLGVEEEQRFNIVDAIIDWRDRDNLRRLHGAEDDDYRSADLPYGAKDALFTNVEELVQVMGMTPPLYRRLAPLVTVYSRQAKVNPAVAPQEVLLALPEMTENQVQDLLQERAEHMEDENGVSVGPGPATQRLAGRQRLAYSVRAQVRLPNGASPGIEVVLTVTRSVHDPYRILHWTELLESPKTSELDEAEEGSKSESL